MSFPSDGSAESQLAPPVCDKTTCPGARPLTQARTLKRPTAGSNINGVLTVVQTIEQQGTIDPTAFRLPECIAHDGCIVHITAAIQRITVKFPVT